MSRPLALGVLLATLGLASSAQAATFTPTTGDELAAALDVADSNGEDDVITIAEGAGNLTRVGGATSTASRPATSTRTSR